MEHPSNKIHVTDITAAITAAGPDVIVHMYVFIYMNTKAFPDF